MLRKRILSAVVVRSGRAVQSFGFNRWLPLGDVKCLVQNLDQWNSDGIVILDTDRHEKGPNLVLLETLSEENLKTPLTYGGGISSAEDARLAVKAGAERLILDRVLSSNPQELSNIAATVGKQALIASVPIVEHEGSILHYQHWDKKLTPLNKWLKDSIWQSYTSEILAIDVLSEGSCHGPNKNLFQLLGTIDLPLLILGGVSTACQIENLLVETNISAVVIGNALNYKENSIAMLKNDLKSLPIRPNSVLS